MKPGPGPPCGLRTGASEDQTMNGPVPSKRIVAAWACCLGLLLAGAADAAVNIAQEPLYLGGSAAPLNMLVLGRDHRLYYEAYNDASDLNGDGVLDTTYKPAEIDYFGYFDSRKCYSYRSSSGRFEPVSRTANKTCSGQWSGDFLNYLTTSRIDALRKVLYGGTRVVDTDDLVVLERSYIPQDAHSWGKEYHGIVQDGYDIRDYAPLDPPVAGTRHLFANTTLLKSGDMEPRLRVLTHSSYRIWEWVAIERPVAGSDCEDNSGRRNCEDAGTSTCEVVPDMALTQETYRVTRKGPETGNDYVRNKTEFDVLEAWNAIPSNFCGAKSVDEVDGSGNPFNGVNNCTNDLYLTLFSGTLTIANAGYYTFAVDGDDAVEFSIGNNVVAAWYGAHGQCGDDRCRCGSYTGQVFLLPGTHQVRFRHQEHRGADTYYLRWWKHRPPSVMTDYFVRVEVCDPAVGLESNCRVYPAGGYKPTGLLQKHGEDDQMLFGLISGSYTHPHNMQGGVVRKNMGSITDEIDLHTGAWTDTVGIIRSIDRMRVVDFNQGSNFEYAGGWLTTEPMSASSSKQFPDWGNPIGEMLYEGVRYFAGKQAPTPEFMPSRSNGMESITLRDYVGSSTMQLPLPDWTDPLDDANSTTAWCSAGALLVISDIYPSYDTDAVPGSAFSSFSGDVAGLNCAAEADAIWVAEHGSGSRQHFIGQVGSDYDGAPTEKTVSGLGNVRGLAPEEPTKQGGYYSAAVSKFAFETDLRPDLRGTQNLNTVVVALASPLPKIEIPVGGTVVTIVPFAKSVGGFSINRDRGAFQPTNTIVDFFVDTFANTDPNGSDADASINNGLPYVRFRINFEDVEQGADHDMDAIIIYELRANADDTLTVNLTSEYAAGSIMHHLGYVISGTTADGVYLEVRDKDTGSGSDVAYFLDTPSGLPPGACAVRSPPSDCNPPMPLTATRVFTPSGLATGATLLKSPLWYAAKYGTADSNQLAEGEASNNYFLVTNATHLEKQLDSAFYEILGLISSASAAATNSTLLRDDTLVYQARFDPDDWSGEIRAMEVNKDGSLGGMRWNTNEPGQFEAPGARRIYTWNGAEGVELRTANWDELSLTQCGGLLGMDLDAVLAALDIDDAEDGTCADLDAVAGLDTDLARKRLDWLRGDDAEELTGVLRDRHRLLGDIVHSNPFLVDMKDYAFEPLSFAGPETSYDLFRATLKAADNGAGRRPVLYVGANDGMLHAFDGNTGAELFAYAPHEAFHHIAELTDPDYQHRYYVDGSPWAVDAFIDSDGLDAWRTVLVGTTGAGGRAVFALDVTDPETFGPEQVLWEFTHNQLGFTFGQATIARVADGNRWVALVGNGYNSNSAKAQLFVIDLASGRILKRINTGVGSGANPNGLASPTPVDVNFDRIADYVYAGDLQGNLWKFDLTGARADWGVAYAGAPLFTATDVGLAPQPITHRPAVARHPRGGVLVLFGTGKFFSDNDNVVDADTQVQSFYGIWDHGAPVGPRATTLQEQSIIYQGAAGNPDIRNDVRVTSNEAVDWSQQAGWFLDLSYAGSVEGERVIDGPIMRTDRIVFTTLIPNDDECSSGGNSWLMELDFITGARLAYSAFDLNDDEYFGLDDFIDIKVPSPTNPGTTTDMAVATSGIFIPAIAKAPAFITIGYKDVKYSSLSSGLLLDVDNRSDLGSGRQSWRQLR
jgi:type IV pilus assembly protein PilY1